MNENFKERLSRLMREKNINQIGLADEIGITQSTLSRNLNGVHRPKAEIVEKIASFFNVSTDYLLGKTDDRLPTPTSSPKDQLQGIKLALYNQTEELTEEQMEDVLKFVEFIKNKDK